MAGIDLEKFKGHTEGPWFYQEHSDAYTHIVRGPNNCFVLNAPQGTRGADEANARLAAAAPDLLAELTKARQAIRDLREVLKAEFESRLPCIGDSVTCTTCKLGAALASTKEYE